MTHQLLIGGQAAQEIDGLLDCGNLDHLEAAGNRDGIGVIINRAEEICRSDRLGGEDLLLDPADGADRAIQVDGARPGDAATAGEILGNEGVINGKGEDQAGRWAAADFVGIDGDRERRVVIKTGSLDLDTQLGRSGGSSRRHQPDIKAQLGPGTLDQQQNLHNHSVGYVVMAQTFTAGAGGTLTAVSLWSEGSKGGEVTVEICSVSEGIDCLTPALVAGIRPALATGVLASTTLTVGNSNPQWIDFAFSPPPVLVASTQYAIVIDGNDGWSGSITNAYTGGSASSPGPGITWIASNNVKRTMRSARRTTSG